MVRLAHHGCEHVQAPAVRHAEIDLFDTKRAAALDDLLHRRNHRFTTIDTKALRALIFDMEVVLKALSLNQLAEDCLLAFRRELDLFVHALDPALKPLLLVGVGDVGEFDREGTAISPAEDLEDRAQGRALETQDHVEEDLTVIVFIGEAVAGRIELRMHLDLAQRERVEIGDHVPAHAVSPNQHQGTDGIMNRGPNILFRGASSSFLLLDFLGQRIADAGPVAAKCCCQLITRTSRPIITAPAWTISISLRSFRTVTKGIKVSPQRRIDGVGVLRILGKLLFEINGVAARQERDV